MNDIDRNVSYLFKGGLVCMFAYIGKVLLNPVRHAATESSTNGTICYQDDDGDEVTSKYCPRKK